jgi:hypothetical protein
MILGTDNIDRSSFEHPIIDLIKTIKNELQDLLILFEIN